ncbi:hypothetical protein GCM10023094_54400 [Rhodococcus olei]|uniref:DUF6779 domain-containing protein n=1 Tax=Rhodococcus olei TaxID=2161675 RepID=A0ABP8PQR0_9NOCA
MTLPGRAASIRRNKRSASQMIVAGLVVLAVVASLFLIFSDSVQVLRIGLMAALWAAVIGAIAMTKYRRESAADKAKVRDLQTVYELQLEREVSARREYEAGVEARVRSELNVDVTEIAALRAELAALRGSLEILFDGRMPVDRLAIAADAARIGELGPAAPSRTAAVRPPVPFAPRPAYADPASGPTFATPFDEPVTAEVSLVDDEADARSAADAAARVPASAPVARRVEPGAVRTGRVDTPAAETGSRRAQAPAPASAPPGASAPASAPPEAPVSASPEPTTGTPESEVTIVPEPAGRSGDTAGDADGPTSAPRRSRRRAEVVEQDGVEDSGAHSNGLTVAEIMANMQAATPGAGGARSGRRRRE